MDLELHGTPFFMSGSATPKTPAASVLRAAHGRRRGAKRTSSDGEQQNSAEQLQQSAGNTGVTAVLSGTLPSPIPSEARVLDPSLRAVLEARFQADFSAVRVHAGERAAELAESRNASAYTQGPNIVFARDQFAPWQDRGRRLLVHELAHVVQQMRAGGFPGFAQERDAEGAAAHASGAGVIPVSTTSAPGSIQCAPESASRDPSLKEADVEVPWADYDWDFEDRVVAAVRHSRGFRGVPKDSLPFALNRKVGDLHSDLAKKGYRNGRRIRIHVSANYNRDAIPTLSNVSVTLASSEQAAAKNPAPPSVPAGHAQSEQYPGGPAFRELARDVAGAERAGYGGAKFEVFNRGKGPNLLSYESVNPGNPRPGGMVEFTADDALREMSEFARIVEQSTGKWEGRFERAKWGALHFVSWKETGDPPPAASTAQAPTTPRRQLSFDEEFEQQTGVVSPRRINKALQETAIKALHDANPFLLKNLPYTIGGIVIPMGAMKVAMMDWNEVSFSVRITWSLDEDLAAGVAEARAAGMPEARPFEPPPVRELKVGDVIDTTAGSQRVVEIGPGKLVTEPAAPGKSVAATGQGGARPPATPSRPPSGGGPPPSSPPPGSPTSSSPPPRSTPPANDDVWVELAGNKRIRAFNHAEVTRQQPLGKQPPQQPGAPVKNGDTVTTPEGGGRVVKVGQEPPHSSQVAHEPAKPFFSDQDLNRPVPQDRMVKGSRRRLNAEERENARTIQEALRRLERGDPQAETDLAPFNRKGTPMTHPPYEGWTELDLLPGNPGALNQMRVIFRWRPDGTIEAKLLQVH